MRTKMVQAGILAFALFWLSAGSVFAQGVCTCTDSTTSIMAGVVTKTETHEITTYGGGKTITSASMCTIGCSEWRSNSGTHVISASYVESVESSDTSTSSTDTSTTTPKKLITPSLSVDIPTVTFSKVLETKGEDGKTYLSINYLGDYIAGVYKYLLGISTTIAIVMLMVSGLQWTLGGQSAEAVGKAQTRIKNAVTGLVLLLSAYLILFTVNPNLVSLTFPKLELLQEVPLANLLVEISGSTTTNTCKGSECFGASVYQDCMLRQYGGSESEVSAQLVPVTVDYAGHKATYKVHKNVQTKFQAVFDAIAESGTTYDITKSFEVFNWRAVTGQPKYLSNHSWGTAVDINPDTNPYCSSECFDEDTDTECICVGANCQTDCPAGKYDLPTEVVKAFKDQGFDWLGDRKAGDMQDYMHFDAPTGCTTK